MATKTFKVALSLDNPRIIQSGITVQSFDKQSVKISIALTKDSQTYQIPIGATIRISLLKLSNQAQKIIVDVPNDNRESIDWIVPDYLDGYHGVVRCGVYLLHGTESVDLGYFTILSNVSDIDKMAEEFTDNVFGGWEAIEEELRELNITIAQTKLDLAADMAQVDITIANINAKNTQVNTLASNFTADVATKQADVTSKYNAFDASVTQANQEIADILALTDDVQQIADDVLDLKIFVNQPNADIFGVEVDVENKTFTRLLGAVGKTAGTDFDSVKAFGGRRRCNVTDSGVVTAYFGETGYTETGALTQQIGSHAIGTKVQVMVEQPKFYYRTVPIKLEPISGGIGYHLRKARYYISDTPRAGFALHPAFISNGEELDALYLSAYEGSLYDESTASYILDDAQVADFATDRLSSIAGVKPISGLTQNLSRANARLLAQKRGEGWQQQYSATAALTQLLMLIEYNTFNLQTALGAGVTNKPDGTGNESEPTGATALLGNKSGTAKTLNGYDAVSYRGEENPYGNIFKFVDGLNVLANGIHQAYIADNAFADSKKDGSYRNAGITLAKTTGYISAFGYSPTCDYLFLPSETLGNTAVPVGDYFYQNAVATDGGGWRTAYLGGLWNYATRAGAFCLLVANVFSNRNRSIGARSVYARKKAVA